MTQTFQRARNDAQRAERRDAILGAAVELLAERRVAELSLNELARRAGLAKSNVLRYFESREAVLLEVYDRELGDWLDALGPALAALGPAAGPTPGGLPPTAAAGAVPAAAVDLARVDAVARVLVTTIEGRRILCELTAAAASVLEHNISGAVAAAYKRAAMASGARLGGLVAAALGRPADEASLLLSGGVHLAVGGIWAGTQHSPGMEAAYLEHPELAQFRHGFGEALQHLLSTLLAGYCARTAPARG